MSFNIIKIILKRKHQIIKLLVNLTHDITAVV